MPLRMPSQLGHRAFSTTTRTRASMSPHFHTYNPSTPQLTMNSTSVPKLGRIGRWYLPTMALLAVGMTASNVLTKSTTSYSPSKRTVTFDSANRRINYAIANALEEHNTNQKVQELTQQQRNTMLLDAYGSRSTLEDMERAFDMVKDEVVVDQRERNRRLAEAYGEKSSLKDIERAMEMYEVQ